MQEHVLLAQEREEALLSFKGGNTKILVATDVLSRGIDIDNIALVINYDVPMDAEDYVHRVGRTARAESTGMAITLVNEQDQFRLAQIEELIENEIPKIPLPPELGAGPSWNPKRRLGHSGSHKKSGGHRKGNFRRRSSLFIIIFITLIYKRRISPDFEPIIENVINLKNFVNLNI